MDYAILISYHVKESKEGTQMNRRMKWIIALAMTVIILCIMPQSVRADEDEDTIVIVIDPGHGGSQNGAEYNGMLEKDINIVVAQTMADELEKYDNVEIHLTHTSSEDEMSIKERAEFADDVDADYFFCIHFNASGNHNFYGAEAWITSYGRYYSQMYAFSEILMEEFEAIGVFNRGIKTKLGTDGTDYYGVLRRGAEFDIPAVIIEHCHMDNEADSEFLDEEADLVRFGELDAVAVAKFLNLKSSELGVDYSDYEVTYPDEPEEPIKNDETAPECKLTLVSMDDKEKKVTFRVEASDEEYPILYYGYSFDKGETFTPLYPWENGQASMEFSLDYAECTTEDITVVVYNAFNMGKNSEAVSLKEVQEKLRVLEQQEKEAEAAAKAAKETIVVEMQTGGEIYLIIVALCVLGILVAIVGLFVDINKRKM